MRWADYLKKFLDRIPFRLVHVRSLEEARPTDPVSAVAETVVPAVREPKTALFAEPRRLDWSKVSDIDPACSLGAYFRDSVEGDIYKWHHYFDIYDEAFARFRQNPDLRILEIGVYVGGSLRMWADYFHPAATIVGIDIDPLAADRVDQTGNVAVRIGDQTDTAFLDQVVAEFGPFDIVVDDGGHKTHHMTESFAHLYLTGLRDDGVYLVEDTHTNYWPDFISDPEEPTFLELCKSLTDRLNEPYHVVEDVERFLAGQDESRLDSTTEFYAHTHSMTFYDSIVLFVKRPKTFPRAEIR